MSLFLESIVVGAGLAIGAGLVYWPCACCVYCCSYGVRKPVVCPPRPPVPSESKQS